MDEDMEEELGFGDDEDDFEEDDFDSEDDLQD